EFGDLPSRPPDAACRYCEPTHCVVAEATYAATARPSARSQGAWRARLPRSTRGGGRLESSIVLVGDDDTAASATSASRTQSATPGGASVPPVAQPAADITAITTHDDFLLELGQTLGGQAGVHPVESVEAALAALRAGKRGQVLVIDTRDVD